MGGPGESADPRAALVGSRSVALSREPFSSDGSCATRACKPFARRRLMAIFLAVSLVALLLGWSATRWQNPAVAAIASHGGSGIVSPAGSIGRLRLDRSRLVDIERFAGQADFEGHGSFFQGPNPPGITDFIALGYSCPARPQQDAAILGLDS